MHPTTTCTVTNASLLHCNTALSQLSGRCRHRPSASATSTPTRSTTQPLCNEPSVTPSRAVSCHDTLAMHMRLDLSGQAEALATCTMNMTYHPNRSTTTPKHRNQQQACKQGRSLAATTNLRKHSPGARGTPFLDWANITKRPDMQAHMSLTATISRVEHTQAEHTYQH
jgi:hypothetical protein